MIDPAWVAAGLMFTSQVGLSVYTITRNGKASAEWKGQTQARVDALENSVAEIKTDIKTIAERVTESQGAV